MAPAKSKASNDQGEQRNRLKKARQLLRSTAGAQADPVQKCEQKEKRNCNNRDSCKRRCKQRDRIFRKSDRQKTNRGNITKPIAPTHDKPGKIAVGASSINVRTAGLWYHCGKFGRIICVQ